MKSSFLLLFYWQLTHASGFHEVQWVNSSFFECNEVSLETIFPVYFDSKCCPPYGPSQVELSLKHRANNSIVGSGSLCVSQSVGTPHIDLFRSPFPISVAASHHPSPLWHRIFSLSFLLNFSIVAAPVTVFSLPLLSFCCVWCHYFPLVVRVSRSAGKVHNLPYNLSNDQ